MLFYAAGLAECFDGIVDNKSLDKLREDHPELRFAEAVSKHISEELGKDPELTRRVGFITALDLFSIFSRVKGADLDHLRLWFFGETQGVHYDAPKIVESIVRLRILGNGVPVFRLDWDVLFSSEKEADLGLFKAVAVCMKAYRLRLDDPTVATFLFSASYDTRRLRDATPGVTFDDWRGAFATRVFPALPIIPDLLTQAKGGKISWEDYATQAFNDSLARKFYGLLPNGLKSSGIDGLTKIGAHPMVSVISGAFLCLSDSAILDLPPFSNFGVNVSWIDDHLKYCLHRELRHLTSLDLRLAERSLSDAKLDDVVVTKARGKIVDLPGHVLDKYLPTLLWGTVVDAWINPDPLLKCRPDDLTATDKARWHQLHRSGLSAAILPQHLQNALETGRITPKEKHDLKESLVKEALKRINEVRELWAQLTDSGSETFASIWAKGSVHNYFPNLSGRTRGIAPTTPLTDPLTEDTQLNTSLLHDFNQVVQDAVAYIDWTLNWPQIVHIVRSLEQGTLRTDVSWKPQHTGSSRRAEPVRPPQKGSFRKRSTTKS